MEVFCYGGMPSKACAFVNENAVVEMLGFSGKKHAKRADEFPVPVVEAFSFSGKPMGSCPRAP